MIVKKYRLILDERNIWSLEDNKWLTKEERNQSKGHIFLHWSNESEYFTKGSLIAHFEEYFRIGFPADWEEKIVEIPYDVPEGEFVLTKCSPSYEYSTYKPNRNLYRFCRSVQEVLDYLDDDNKIEVFRVVLGQFKLEKPLTTLFVTDPYSETRCWKYSGA